MPYLEPTDENAFLDLPVMENKLGQHSTDKEYVLCHVCKGHGKWNLKLHAYGPSKHFQAGCSQCNGWGWVMRGSLDDTCERHDWSRELSIAECKEAGIDHFGNFWHVRKCSKCGDIWSYDSRRLVAKFLFKLEENFGNPFDGEPVKAYIDIVRSGSPARRPTEADQQALDRMDTIIAELRKVLDKTYMERKGMVTDAWGRAEPVTVEELENESKE
jgi:hypothetical protein